MTRKICILINPNARGGRTDEVLQTLIDEFAGDDFDFYIPESREAMGDCAREAVKLGCEAVIVVGGDGSTNHVINAIAGTGVRLGVIPAGTANDLARELGLPTDLKEICQRIKEGRVRKVDLIECNGRYYITGGGLGAISDVAIGVNKLKRVQGPARHLVRLMGGAIYTLYSVFALMFARGLATRMEVEADGKKVGTYPAIAFFVNNQSAIGKNVMATPQARPDDGLLEGCALRTRSRLRTFFSLLLMMKGRHTRRSEVAFYRAKELKITTARAKHFIGDGEVLAKTRNLLLRVHPGMLPVIA